MVKQGLKRLLKRLKRRELPRERSEQFRTHRLSDHRIVPTTLRMIAELAAQAHGEAKSAAEPKEKSKEGESAADYQAAIDAELDRLVAGHPRPPQYGGRRIVMLTCPGGNS